MIEIFKQGGPLMYPILVCSIIGWAIFLERFSAYFITHRRLVALRKAVLFNLHKNNYEEAFALCARNRSALGKILQVVLDNRGRRRSELKSMAEEIGEREAVALQRYLGLLGTIANVAPLLGLLGTVVGMIEAFNVIASKGVGSPATLGGGISQALITTAAGLTVAVPMILLHRYLLSRSDRLVLELEEAAMQVVDLIKE